VAVVLTIIMIASSIALNAYTTHSRYSGLESTSREIVRALVFSRQTAISRRTDTIFNFDITRQVYWVDERDIPTGALRSKVVEPKQLATGVVVDKIQIGSIAQASGTVTARFDLGGENPLIKIHLRRSMDPAIDANYYTVMLHPSSDDPRILPRERR